MLVSVASFSVMDAHAQAAVGALPRAAGGIHPRRGVVAVRAAAASLLRGRLARLRPVNVRLHLLRGALAVLMLYSFVQAVRESSLATTYSIFMFAPLLVAALSVPMLRGARGQRRSGWRSASASSGVLLMLRPVDGQLAVDGLAVGTRRRRARMPSRWSRCACWRAPIRPKAWCSGSRPCSRSARACWRFRAGATSSGHDLPLILGVGIWARIGQHLITVAFRSAPAAVVAPFEYTALLWGVLLDIAIWSVYPECADAARRRPSSSARGCT